MKKSIFIPIFFIFSLFSFNSSVLSAQIPSDSITFSLLTCSPGEEIYTLFGHTAIRCQNHTKDYDLVFNYGLFSFAAPNFEFRFMRGVPDYRLGLHDYKSFAVGYSLSNRSITEQVLNLTQEEKTKLWSLLIKNYEPQNRIYRYNIFYDNCATRPRDKVEECLTGDISYSFEGLKANSFRDLIYECTKEHLWSRFAIDFCLGSKADLPITHREEMFIPFYLHDYFATAHIKSASGERKLVQKTNQLLSSSPDFIDEASFDYPDPLPSAVVLLLVIAVLTFWEYKKRRRFKIIDVLLFLAAGITGSIVAFLVCFSDHPTVSPNYLLLIFHPFHIFILPLFFIKRARRFLTFYKLVNFAILTLFILFFWLLPQRINLAVVPLALCLLLRTANCLLNLNRK